MAKNANKAANKTDLTLDVVEHKLTERASTSAATAIEKFGRPLFLKAAFNAIGAIERVEGGEQDVKRLEGEILLKREGNASVLWNLAKECVKLTVKDGKAMLLDAAELMEAACAFAEEDCVARYNKAHNTSDAKMRQILPSWPVLKANQLNAMKKAGLNPSDFAGPTKVVNAYNEWKAANPESVDARGARPQAPEGPKELPKPVTKAAETMVKLEDTARSAIIALVAAIQTKPAKSQHRAAEMISSLIKQINALKDEESTEAPVTRTRPNPARVPESNQQAA